jgi:hypothetical protein
MSDVRDLERACRSLTCSINHLQNARDNAAFEEQPEIRAIMDQTMAGLSATRTHARQLLRRESAMENDD